MTTDTERQEQYHLDFRLAKEEERSKSERSLEAATEEHKRALEEAQYQLQLRKEREFNEAALKLEREKLALEAERDRLHIQKLEAMKELDVDLTQFLVAQQKAPDKYLKIENGQSQANGSVQMHIHENNI